MCNLADELGTLEVNKIADVIVVDSNPLDDLDIFEKISLVIPNEEIIRNDLY